MLRSLAAIHPTFARWYKQAHARAEANEAFCAMPPQIDELTEIFEKGRHYKDISHELMPTLGYSISAWNGIDSPCDVALHAHAGDYGGLGIFPNQLELNLPALRDGNADLINTKCVKAVLLTIVDAWEPSSASTTDWSYSQKFFSPGPMPPFRSGWMTYLAAPYARRIIPPPSAITEPVAGGGILMLATNEPFDVGNPQHVAVADAIQASLEPLQANPLLGTAP